MSFFKHGTWALAIAGAVIGGGVAQAATFDSGAYAARLRAGALDTVSADAIAGSTAGSTPGAYAQTGTLAAINQSQNVGASGLATISDRITAGIGTERASSDGATQAIGTITLAAPTLSLNANLQGTTTALAGLTADAISSTTQVFDMGGILTAAGSASIANLQFTGAFAPITAALATLGATVNGASAANSTYSLLGNTVVLTLNEQIRTLAAGSLGLETNALHLSLNGFGLATGGTLSGDVVLGHSAARVVDATAAVPEPASWAMMLAGFGLMGGTLRAARRRQGAVLA